MTNLEIGFHAVDTIVMVLIFVGVADKHTLWVRMKDRMNILWAKHCKESGDPYVALENGKH